MDNMRDATFYAGPLMQTLDRTVPKDRTDVLLQSPLVVAAMAAHTRGMSAEEFMAAAGGIFLEVGRQIQQ